MKAPGAYRVGEFHIKDPDDYYPNDYSPFGIQSTTWVLRSYVHERFSRKRRVIKLQKSYGRTPEEGAMALWKATGIKPWRHISHENYRVIKHRAKIRKLKRKRLKA